MQNFKPGTDVPLTFSLVDESGVVLTPVSLRWRVLNEADVELQAWTVVSTMPSTSQFTVTIPSALTALIAPQLRGVRTVELEVTTTAVVVTLSDAIMIQGATVLAFGINTFQTYGQAILLAEDFTPDQIADWSGSDRDTREKAMIQAYQRILQLPIHTGGTEGWNQSMLTSDTVISNIGSQLRYMTPAQMLNLYPALLTALRSAQFVEAASILKSDPTRAARAEGLLSLTVGESSQFFQAGKALEHPVCKEALAYLQRWIRTTARIGRR